MISKRSNIAVIGAGKIAYSLVSALVKNGYRLKLIISSNYDAAKNLAKKFSIKNYSDKLTNLDTNIRIIFISVPDNQIKIIADKLARLNINVKDSLFIHFSGAENISNLNSLWKRGALTASFHIMQTFPSKRIVKVDNCYVSIETENKFAERFLFKLAGDLKLKPFKLSSEEKVLYHLTGVFASNFLVGNIFSSEKIFNIKKNKITYNNFDFLLPLIKSTFKNLNKFGSSKALSGPIERGDLSTVKKHINALKRKINPKKLNEIYLSYIIQSLNLLNVVKSKYGKLSKKHLKLRQYLLDEVKKTLSQ
ncbi:MAG: Rossmann-like and DUF2520 domain-containing protein [Candidatus Thorarchaeota archaeon]